MNNFICNYAITVERARKLQLELSELKHEKVTVYADINAKKRALASYEKSCDTMNPSDDTYMHMIMLKEKCRGRITQQTLAYQMLQSKQEILEKQIAMDKKFVVSNRQTFLHETKNCQLPFNHQEIVKGIYEIVQL